ncbi:hypothetical protein AVEN_115376-1 [Araneus ventricosus]|uniref:Uncharacterized protein n=1 Tax=Araneus ventricosus TaxID=182803 RepID=A0A4Y1ZYA6_ARAVE|nr:hypothetical protein AVEN_115376-1 [Araneus ventricosus]
MNEFGLLSVSSIQHFGKYPIIGLSIEYSYSDCLLQDTRHSPHCLVPSLFTLDSFSNQSHVTFCAYMRISYDEEHACVGNIPGTNAECPLQSAAPYARCQSASSMFEYLSILLHQELVYKC